MFSLCLVAEDVAKDLLDQRLCTLCLFRIGIVFFDDTSKGLQSALRVQGRSLPWGIAEHVEFVICRKSEVRSSMR